MSAEMDSLIAEVTDLWWGVLEDVANGSTSPADPDLDELTHWLLLAHGEAAA